MYLDAAFLWMTPFLRARSIGVGFEERAAVCASAAAELARGQRDMELVERAVDLVREKVGGPPLDLSPEESLEVVRQEKSSKKPPLFPGDGPDYSDLLPEVCYCPDCRRERDEDEELDEIFDEMEIPPDMPPELARVLFAETKKAIERGESLPSFMQRIFGEPEPGPKRGKGRRRR